MFILVATATIAFHWPILPCIINIHPEKNLIIKNGQTARNIRSLIVAIEIKSIYLYYFMLFMRSLSQNCGVINRVRIHQHR
ncbi:hypothetical protein D3C85_1690410 [compost metagenome]